MYRNRGSERLSIKDDVVYLFRFTELHTATIVSLNRIQMLSMKLGNPYRIVGSVVSYTLVPKVCHQNPMDLSYTNALDFGINPWRGWWPLFNIVSRARFTYHPSGIKNLLWDFLDDKRVTGPKAFWWFHQRQLGAMLTKQSLGYSLQKDGEAKSGWRKEDLADHIIVLRTFYCSRHIPLTFVQIAQFPADVNYEGKVSSGPDVIW